MHKIKEEMVEKVVKATNEFQEFLRQSSLKDREVRELFFGYLAISITHNCFRNGTPLEEIHSGKDIPIPEEASRISDEEMKRLMQASVNNVAFYLTMWAESKELVNDPMVNQFPNGWDIPDWDKVTDQLDMTLKIKRGEFSFEELKELAYGAG